MRAWAKGDAGKPPFHRNMEQCELLYIVYERPDKKSSFGLGLPKIGPVAESRDRSMCLRTYLGRRFQSHAPPPRGVSMRIASMVHSAGSWRTTLQSWRVQLMRRNFIPLFSI